MLATNSADGVAMMPTRFPCSLATPWRSHGTRASIPVAAHFLKRRSPLWQELDSFVHEIKKNHNVYWSNIIMDHIRTARLIHSTYSYVSKVRIALRILMLHVLHFSHLESTCDSFKDTLTWGRIFLIGRQCEEAFDSWNSHLLRFIESFVFFCSGLENLFRFGRWIQEDENLNARRTL